MTKCATARYKLH